MKYKLFVFAPDDKKVIQRIIHTASQAGAGIIGNYSHCAFIQRGQGNWFSEAGSHPTIGKVGEMTTINEVKIEMECQKELAPTIQEAIRKVHPYQEIVVDFVKLEEVDKL